MCTDALQLCVDEARLRYDSIEREGCVILDNGDVVEGPALATLPPIHKIKVSHMARAVSKIFQNPVVETIRALPQQQQMILCSCVRVFGERTDFNKSAKEITLANSSPGTPTCAKRRKYARWSLRILAPRANDSQILDCYPSKTVRKNTADAFTCWSNETTSCSRCKASGSSRTC